MADFISGKHVSTTVFLNDKPWAIRVKSIKVEELANEVTDHVCGEDRARFQKLTDGYRVTIEAHEESADNLNNFIKNQQNEDSNGPQLGLACGIRFSYLDRSKGGFAFSECTLDAMDLNVAGRTERVASTVKFRARHFDPVPAPGAGI